MRLGTLENAKPALLSVLPMLLLGASSPDKTGNVKKAMAQPKDRSVAVSLIDRNEIGTGQEIQKHVREQKIDGSASFSLMVGDSCEQLSSGVGGTVLLEPPQGQGTERHDAKRTHVGVHEPYHLLA